MADASTDVVVVGGGLSGLLAARGLMERGRSVVVLDKGRAVGGRMATRRLGAGRADHGAQFFTVRRPAFADLVEAWREQGLVFRWSRGWSDGSLAAPRGDGHARYAVRGGMSTLAEHLASGLDIRLETRVGAVRPAEDGWSVVTIDGVPFACRAVLLTAPVPQSLLVCDVGGVDLAQSDRDELGRIEYAPSLTGLFQIEGEAALPEPGALQRPDAPIAWLADNRRKGVSAEALVVTVQGSPDWSAREWSRSDEEALAALRSALLPFLSPGSWIKEEQLKRWRYALPTYVCPDPVLVARGVPPLAFAGDAFGGPRVEGAAMSGLAGAAALASRLPPPVA